MDQQSLFIELLQHGISPIVLISGVGVILLSVSNRLGRVTDRMRFIVMELEKNESYITPRLKEVKIEQLRILQKRIKYLRNSITGISGSILSSSLMIPVLILDYLFDPSFQVIGILLFSTSILGIILSAVYLVMDIALTLKAIDKEAAEFI